MDAVWLGRGRASCRCVGRAWIAIHVGGQVFVGRGWEPAMCAGSQRCSYECSEILNSREAMVIESMAVAVSWRKKKSNVGLGAYA